MAELPPASRPGAHALAILAASVFLDPIVRLRSDRADAALHLRPAAVGLDAARRAAAAEPALRRGDDRAGRRHGRRRCSERMSAAERDGGLPRRGQAAGDPARRWSRPTMPTRTDKAVVFDTNRMWCARLPLIRELYPEARVLCCVRNVAWIMDSFERLVRRNAFEPSTLFATARGARDGLQPHRGAGAPRPGGRLRLFGAQGGLLRRALGPPAADRLRHPHAEARGLPAARLPLPRRGVVRRTTSSASSTTSRSSTAGSARPACTASPDRCGSRRGGPCCRRTSSSGSTSSPSGTTRRERPPGVLRRSEPMSPPPSATVGTRRADAAGGVPGALHASRRAVASPPRQIIHPPAPAEGSG